MRAPPSLAQRWRSAGSKRRASPRRATVTRRRRTSTLPSTTVDPRVLLHLVLAELLARLRARSAPRARRRPSGGRRVARAVRRVDREQVPVLHGRAI